MQTGKISDRCGGGPDYFAGAGAGAGAAAGAAAAAGAGAELPAAVVDGAGCAAEAAWGCALGLIQQA